MSKTRLAADPQTTWSTQISSRLFLPVSGQGHILITSRALNFDAVGVKAIPIEPPPHAEAQAFLLRRTNRQNAGRDERQAAALLAAELGNLPLALEQAAAYLLGETESRFSDYLATYRQRGGNFWGGPNPEAGTRHEPPLGFLFRLVSKSWRKWRLPAPDLLRAAAFLAPAPIPEELFKIGGAMISSALGTVISKEGIFCGR